MAYRHWSFGDGADELSTAKNAPCVRSMVGLGIDLGVPAAFLSDPGFG